jgi:hypothetical protein
MPPASRPTAPPPAETAAKTPKALPGLLGQTAQQRGRREEQDAGHEDPAPPEDVTGPPAEEQQTAEGEGVGADHPGQVGGAEFEGVLNVRERDVHNRRVEDHHELAGRDDRERDAGMSFPTGRSGLLFGNQLRGRHYGSPTSTLVNARVHWRDNGSDSPTVNASVH